MFRPGGEILLPPPDVSDDVDAEGELGVIIGRSCRFIPPDKASQAIYGYTTTLDLTALDVLRKNPRYLTRAKSIDTFFSFGPVIVTADEVPDVDGLEVITEHNGAICSRDFVRNMKMRPFDLVAFHSDFFTLHPGDILSTGCPKGARIKAGDTVRSRIDGVFWIEPELVSSFPEQQRLAQLSKVLTTRTGKVQQLTRIEPIFDSEQEIKGYMAFARQ
jgi:2-keto-4-pentenoate hydratase/2-oxohepta-3-ene-1,7-dioic acid hydratase in catechol pathway